MTAMAIDRMVPTLGSLASGPPSDGTIGATVPDGMVVDIGTVEFAGVAAYEFASLNIDAVTTEATKISGEISRYAATFPRALLNTAKPTTQAIVTP